jgi:DNA-binding NarL/FixJ family response regulator
MHRGDRSRPPKRRKSGNGPLRHRFALHHKKGGHIVIQLVLGSPEHAFRQALAADFQGHPKIMVVAATGDAGRLRMLVANLRPALVVLDACWLAAWPDLLGQLAVATAPPRILLCADKLATPEVLAAVQQGVRGCVPSDALAASWHKAILAVDAGETWIPRWLMGKALADLVQRRPAALPALHLEKLTERQCEIVGWVGQGLSNKEIGRRLGISPTTVKTHLQNIFERIGVRGRQQLGVQARRGEMAA